MNLPEEPKKGVKAATGYWTYLGAGALMLVGLGMIWFSSQPGFSEAARVQLFSTGISLIPMAVGLMGLRRNQSRQNEELEDQSEKLVSLKKQVERKL